MKSISAIQTFEFKDYNAALIILNPALVSDIKLILTCNKKIKKPFKLTVRYLRDSNTIGDTGWLDEFKIPENFTEITILPSITGEPIDSIICNQITFKMEEYESTAEENNYEGKIYIQAFLNNEW